MAQDGTAKSRVMAQETPQKGTYKVRCSPSTLPACPAPATLTNSLEPHIKKRYLWGTSSQAHASWRPIAAKVCSQLRTIIT
ncbi:hypothetical protein ABBQ38_013458 [Trebouxia sp. C0009 RCD-2024]